MSDDDENERRTAARYSYYCPRCGERRPLGLPCGHVGIHPDALERVRALIAAHEIEELDQ